MHTLISFKGECATKNSDGYWCIDFNEFATVNEVKGYILRKISKPATRTDLGKNYNKVMQQLYRKLRAKE